jgi:hypothetical protein
VDVADFIADLHEANSHKLPITTVAEEWKLIWNRVLPPELSPLNVPELSCLPSSLELGQLMCVHSQRDMATEIMLHISLPELKLTFADSRPEKAHTSEELVLVFARDCSCAFRYCLDGIGTSLLTGKLGAKALWVDIHQSRDLTRYPVVKPLPLTTFFKVNPNKFDAGAGLAIDPRMQGFAFSLLAGDAVILIGKSVLLVVNCIVKSLLEETNRTFDLLAAPAPTGEVKEAVVSLSQTQPPPIVPIDATCAHYVIRNHTGLLLHYGQAGTDECSALEHGQQKSYAWCSVSPALVYPLGAPPESEPPFACPEPAPIRERQRDAPDPGLHHWLRLSADATHDMHWSQAFVLDVLGGTSSKSLSDINKRVLAGPAHRLQHVRVYCRQRGFSQPEGAGPIVTHATVVFIRCESRGMQTIVTLLPSHVLANHLPFELSLHILTRESSETATNSTTPSKRARPRQVEFCFVCFGAIDTHACARTHTHKHAPTHPPTPTPPPTHTQTHTHTCCRFH